MTTVEIVESFTGYPGKAPVHFAKGDRPTVSDSFAELIIGKGHARLAEDGSRQKETKG